MRHIFRKIVFADAWSRLFRKKNVQ